MAEPKKYKKDDKAPSELFLDAIDLEGGHGSYEMTCGWCNRLHLCPDVHWGNGTDDRKDADSFREYALSAYKENPEGVVLHEECDFISGRLVNSINFVLLCPCNGLSRYETFIWEHRTMIRGYLKTRIDNETRLALEEQTANTLAGFDMSITHKGVWE